MSKYVNPMYDQSNGQDKIEKRRAWLEDKITQMGHHPDKYEKWHAELDNLNKRQTVVKPQMVVGRSAGTIKSYGNFKKCTDNELHALLKAVEKEIKSRQIACEKVEKAKLLGKKLELEDQGWLILTQAFGEVRRIIIEHEIFDHIKTKQDLTDKTLKKMFFGNSQPYRQVGPMTQGVYRYGKNPEALLIEPKQLLCHIINHVKAKVVREEQEARLAEAKKEEAKLRKANEEYMKQMRKHNEQLHRTAQQIVMAEMIEERKNSCPEEQTEELTDQEKLIMQINLQGEWFRRVKETKRKLMDAISEKTVEEAAQSLSNTDQEEQNG